MAEVAVSQHLAVVRSGGGGELGVEDERGEAGLDPDRVQLLEQRRVEREALPRLGGARVVERRPQAKGDRAEGEREHQNPYGSSAHFSSWIDSRGPNVATRSRDS